MKEPQVLVPKRYVVELVDESPEGTPRLVGPFTDPADAVAWAAAHSVLTEFCLTELVDPWTVEAVTG